MEEKRSYAGLVFIIMLLVGVGLAIGGFYIGKSSQPKCLTKSASDQKEEVVFEDEISKEEHCDEECNVTFNGKEHKVRLERGETEFSLDRIYLDDVALLNDSKFVNGFKYYTFKATDDQEYLVLGFNHNFNGKEYVVSDKGKVIKEIDFQYSDGQLVPEAGLMELYTTVKNGYLYYPQKSNNLGDKGYTVDLVKSEIKDGVVKNIGIEETTDFVFSQNY